MKTMYITINAGSVTDVTNCVSGGKPLHFGVKYIIGGDFVIFDNVDGTVLVSRYRGELKLYTYRFANEGDFMITPLFVDNYKKVSNEVKSLYDYLKKHFNNFYLEEDYTLSKPYEIVYKSWIDIILNHKFSITVNPDLLTSGDSGEIKDNLYQMKRCDLMKLHSLIQDTPIFIDRDAISGINSATNLITGAN